MTITRAKKKFDELRSQILADNKVDIIETYVILDFIEDYVKSGKKIFVDFNQTLLKCAEDKVITPEESELLIREIDKISNFLKTEQIIEWVFFGTVGTSLIGLLVYALLV